MDFSNITIGTSSVVSVEIGNVKIWPTTEEHVFEISQDYFEIGYEYDIIEVTVTSMVDGAEAAVAMTTVFDNIGINVSSSSEVVGEIVYSFEIPYNDSGTERTAEFRFRQAGTGDELMLDILQSPE